MCMKTDFKWKHIKKTSEDLDETFCRAATCIESLQTLVWNEHIFIFSIQNIKTKQNNTTIIIELIDITAAL